MPLTVVVAPDSFKGSLSALEVAEAIAEGWRAVRPQDELHLVPQADGGEGTLDAVAAAVPGAIRHSVENVTGPDGRPVRGEWLALPDGTAVVELAQMSGLPLMRELDAGGATTRGLGEVLTAALDSGARAIAIGLGGSASTDGGVGALAALGLELQDDSGATLDDGGAALAHLATANRSALRPAPAGGVILLSDVTAPLLGPEGAAAIFGPQKGASPEQVVSLDAALARFAAVLGGPTDVAGMGAAGGTGYGFVTAWGATVLSGADYLAELGGLDGILSGADVLISGEGRFDSQSLGGKVVGQLLHAAEAHGLRAGVIAGQVTTEASLGGEPVWTSALVDQAGSVEAAIAEPARWLREAGAAAARHFGDDAR